MEAGTLALLALAGLGAGIVNTLAGGGSFLTVPLLVLFGLPGNVANGTNRIGVLMQSGAAAIRFRRGAVLSFRDALPLLVPLAAGSVTGAIVVTQLSDRVFERAFGVVMLLLLVGLWRGVQEEAVQHPVHRLRHLALFAVGLYGGAFQAGVGLLLLLVIRYTAADLLRANGIKVAVNFCFTLLTLPVFLVSGNVAWLPASALGAGYALGGELGARLAIRGGDRLLKPVFYAAVVALAGRMLGLY